MSHRIIFFTFLCLSLVAWQPLLGQATVSALTRGLETIPDSVAVEDVARVPGGTVTEDSVWVGMPLEVDDELRWTGKPDVADSLWVVVSLDCGSGTAVTLKGAFRVVIESASDGEDCVLNLRSGSAYLTSNENTQVSGGSNVRMGPSSTQYGVRVGRTDQGPVYDLQVFDGEVEARDLSSQVAEDLTAGRTLTAGPEVWQAGELTTGEIGRTAALFAQVDASQARVEGGDVDVTGVFEDLTERYRAVLTDPSEALPRVDLAAGNVNYSVASRTVLYQLNRAEEIGVGQRQQASVYLLRSVTYRNLGDSMSAREQYSRAVELEPAVVSATAQEFGIDERVLTGAPPPAECELVDVLSLAAAVEPDTVPRRAPGRITVQVRSRGLPVEGAIVDLAAHGALPTEDNPGGFGGGGEFEESGERLVSGTTDARGEYHASWSCRLCGRSFVIDVKASKCGSVSELQLFVPIRQ